MPNNIVHDIFDLKWVQIFLQKCLTIKKGLARNCKYFLLCPKFFFLQSKILLWNKIKNHMTKNCSKCLIFYQLLLNHLLLVKKIPTKGPLYILWYYKSKVKKKRKSYCNLCCTIPFSYSTRAPGIWSRGI